MRISDKHLDQWRRDGYTVIEGFLPAAELRSLQAELHMLFPTWEQYNADQYAVRPQYYGKALGGGYDLESPALGEKLNLIGAHPDLIDVAERALGTREVLLAKSQVWAKYGGAEDFDQALHVDVASSILYPPRVTTPEEMTITLYYVDVDLTLGPTYIIPRSHTEQEFLVPYIRPRSQYPKFYANERPIVVRAGSALLYGLRTFHRGSAIMRPRGMRLSHHIVYRRADAHWIGSTCWSDYTYDERLQRLLEGATPRQREVFGIPRPGHPYWDAQTVAGMASRYPNMDMRPYLEPAGIADSVVNAARERMRRVPSPNDMTYANGVIRRTAYARQWIRTIEPYQPMIAAYYERMLDSYEAVSDPSR